MRHRFLDFPDQVRSLVTGGDRQDRQRAARILEDCGCQVQQADSGQSALAKAAATGFHLVVAELELPDMPGPDFCRRMTGMHPATGPAIICVTEADDDVTLRAVLAAGACDFLFKPVREVELAARAWAVLKYRRQRPESVQDGQLRQALEKGGSVCHQLNQPLQFVLGMVQLALMDVAEGEPVYGQLKAIQEKVEQMGAITGRLIDVIKSGLGPDLITKHHDCDQQ